MWDRRCVELKTEMGETEQRRLVREARIRRPDCGYRVRDEGLRGEGLGW